MLQASGLAVSQLTEGLMWTITDHGGENRVYGLTEDGRRVVGLICMGNRKILIPIPNCAQILPRSIHTDFLCQGNFSPQVDVILEGVENDDWEDIAVNVEVFLEIDQL